MIPRLNIENANFIYIVSEQNEATPAPHTKHMNNMKFLKIPFKKVNRIYYEKALIQQLTGFSDDECVTHASKYNLKREAASTDYFGRPHAKNCLPEHLFTISKSGCDFFLIIICLCSINFVQFSSSIHLSQCTPLRLTPPRAPDTKTYTHVTPSEFW